MAGSVYKKKAKPKSGDRQPRIHIMSLEGNRKELDFFPHLNTNSIPANQKTLVESLKNGSYMPFMGSVPYRAAVDPETKDLIKAHVLDGINSSTSRDSFDNSKQYQAMYQKKKMGGKTRLDMIMEVYDKTDTPVLPRYYHNPLQYFDHVLLADGYVNSFAGLVIDQLVDFIMPKTLGPVLILRNPDKVGDADAQQKAIEKNQDIIQMLKKVDEFYSDDGPKSQDPYLGIPLQSKFETLIRNCLVFGRNCLVFENWQHLPHFEFEGKKYDDIPNVLKTIQSIDMGMIEMDPFTGKLGGLYMYNSVPFISVKNMIYLVNKPANPMVGSLYYGFSMLQRTIDPVRVYRRILAQNYQQFIRTSYAGMGLFLFDSTQYPEDIRDKIRTAITHNFKAGEVGLIDYANIKDFDYKEIKITPEIPSLIQLQEAMVKIMVALIGMPQSLIFDEAAANRATLVGRVISFINNQVSKLRSSLGDQIASQWYLRNFRILYRDKPEILEMFTIGVEFEEMDLETKTEKVQRLLQEIQLNPYKDDYIGKELGDKDYLNHIDPEKVKKQDEQKSQNPLSNFTKKPGGDMFKVEDDKGKVSKVSRTPV